MNDKDIRQIFSHNLRGRLELKNKSQADLARAVGVSQVSVSNWVNGEILPRPKMIEKICNYLQCSADDLLTDHTREVELAPEDVIAEEISNRPRLFKLMLYAARLTDTELDDLIERVKK